MGIEYVELDQLIKESDFITLSCASTEETYHLIDKSKLNQMKKDCIIINTSRGSVVNESDLIYALENNIIKGAALDVFDSEPPNRRLIDLDNVIATPHIGGSTYEAAKNIGEITYDNLNRFINGNELRYVINHKELGLNLIR
jgi:D-3-phosphoglycerate dehydrogenase